MPVVEPLRDLHVGPPRLVDLTLVRDAGGRDFAHADFGVLGESGEQWPWIDTQHSVIEQYQFGNSRLKAAIASSMVTADVIISSREIFLDDVPGRHTAQTKSTAVRYFRPLASLIPLPQLLESL
jgi:hypothetical protein